MNKFKKIKTKIFEHKYILYIIIAVLLIFTVWMNDRYFEGHDTKPHFSNIYALSTTITKSKPFGSRIYPFVANDFGYGTGIFYPLLGDYIPALIYKITSIFSPNIFYSIKLYYLILTIFSAITMYFLSNKIFRNKYYATLSSIMYVFMPYFLSDIFVRDASGETMIFLALPLSFLGLYELFYKKYKKFLIFFVSAYFLGMNSHLVLMIYVTFVLFLFLIFNYKKFIGKQQITYLIISSFLILSLSSPYLVKLLEHKINGNYVVFTENTMSSVESVLSESVELSAYFLQRSHHDNIWLCINTVTLLLFTFTLFARGKNILEASEKAILNYAIIVSAILIFMMSPIMFWDKLPSFLLAIQFPWRLEVILIFLLSLISPLGLNIVKNKELSKYITICLILLTVGVGINYIHFNSTTLVSPTDFDWSAAMGWQKEYLPVNMLNNLDFYNNRDNQIHIIEGVADISTISNNTPNIKFNVTNLKSETLKLQLPRIYYLGYSLMNEQGEKVKYTEDEKGFIQVEINREGNFHFDYRGTNIDNISKNYVIILFIGIIIYLTKDYFLEAVKCLRINS